MTIEAIEIEKTMEDIGKPEKTTQASINTVEQRLNRRTPTARANYPHIKCTECKIEFKPRVREQRFCSKTCRQKYHTDTYYAGKAARQVLIK